MTSVSPNVVAVGEGNELSRTQLLDLALVVQTARLQLQERFNETNNKTSEVKQFEELVQKLRNEKHELETKLDIQQKEFEPLETRLKVGHEQRARLTMDLNAANSKLKDILAERDELAIRCTQFEEVENQKALALESQEVNLSEVNRLRELLQQAEIEKEKLSIKVSDLENQNTELLLSTNNVENDKDLKTELEMTTLELEKAHNNHRLEEANATTKHNRLIKLVNQIEAERNELQAQVNALEQRDETSLTDSSTATPIVPKLPQVPVAPEHELLEKIRQLEIDNKVHSLAVTAQENKLFERLRGVEVDKHKLETRIAELEEQLSEAEQHSSTAALQKQIEELEASKTELELAHKTQINQYTELTESSAAKEHKLFEHLREVEEDKNQLRIQIDKLEAKHTENQNQIQQNTKINADLNNKVTHLESSNAKLELKLVKAESTANQDNNVFERLREVEIDKHKLETRISELETQLSEAKHSSTAALQKQIEELEANKAQVFELAHTTQVNHQGEAVQSTADQERELHKQLNEANVDKNILETRIRELEGQHRKLKESSAAQENELFKRLRNVEEVKHQLEIQINVMKTQVQRELQATAALQQKVSQLEATDVQLEKIESTASQDNSLYERLREVEMDKHKSKTRIAELETQVQREVQVKTELLQKISQLENDKHELKRMQEAMADQHEQNIQAVADPGRLFERLREVEVEKHHLEGRMLELESQEKDTQTKFQELWAANAALSVDKASVESQLAGLETEYQNCGVEMELLDEEVARLQVKCEELEHLQSNASTSVKSTEHNKDRILTASAEQIRTLERRLASSLSESQELKLELEETQTYKIHTDTELEHLRKVVNLLQNEAAARSDTISHGIISHEWHNDAVLGELQSLSNTHATLQEKLVSTELQLSNSRSVAEQSLHDLAEAKEQHVRLAETLVQSRDELQHVKTLCDERIHSLELKLVNAMEFSNEMKIQLDDLRNYKVNADAELDSLRKNAEDTTRQEAISSEYERKHNIVLGAHMALQDQLTYVQRANIQVTEELSHTKTNHFRATKALYIKHRNKTFMKVLKHICFNKKWQIWRKWQAAVGAHQEVRVVKLEREVKELQALLKCLNEEFLHVTAERNSVTSHYNELSDNHDNVSADMLQLQQKHDNLSEKYHALTTQLKNNPDQRLLQQLEQQQQQLIGKTQENISLSKQYEMMYNQFHDLSVDHEKIKTQLQMQSSPKRPGMTSEFLQHQVDSLEEKLEVMLLKTETLETELEKSRADLKSKSALLSRTAKQYAAVMVKNNADNQEKVDSPRLRDTSYSSQSETEHELLTIRNELMKAKEVQHSQQAFLKHLTPENEALKTEIKNLRVQLELQKSHANNHPVREAAAFLKALEERPTQQNSLTNKLTGSLGQVLKILSATEAELAQVRVENTYQKQPQQQQLSHAHQHQFLQLQEHANQLKYKLDHANEHIEGLVAHIESQTASEVNRNYGSEQEIYHERERIPRKKMKKKSLSTSVRKKASRKRTEIPTGQKRVVVNRVSLPSNQTHY